MSQIVVILILAFAFLAYACYKTIPSCFRYSKYSRSLKSYSASEAVTIGPERFHESVIEFFCALMRSVPSMSVNQLKFQFVLDYIKSLPEEYRNHLVDVLNKYTRTASGPVFNTQQVKDGDFDADNVIRLGASFGEKYTDPLNKDIIAQDVFLIADFLDADRSTYLAYLLFRLISIDGTVDVHSKGNSHFESMSEFETYKWIVERLHCPASTFSVIYRSWMKGNLQYWYRENLTSKGIFPQYGEVGDFYPNVGVGEWSSVSQSGPHFEKLDFCKLNTEITTKLFFPAIALYAVTLYFSYDNLFDTLSFRNGLCGFNLFVLMTMTIAAHLRTESKDYKSYVSSNASFCSVRAGLLVVALFYLEGMTICSYADYTYRSEEFCITRPIGKVYGHNGIYVDLQTNLNASDADMQKETMVDKNEQTMLKYLPSIFGGLFGYDQGDNDQTIRTLEIDRNDVKANMSQARFYLTKGHYGYYHVDGVIFE